MISTRTWARIGKLSAAMSVAAAAAALIGAYKLVMHNAPPLGEYDPRPTTAAPPPPPPER